MGRTGMRSIAGTIVCIYLFIYLFWLDDCSWFHGASQTLLRTRTRACARTHTHTHTNEVTLKHIETYLGGTLSWSNGNTNQTNKTHTHTHTHTHTYAHAQHTHTHAHTHTHTHIHAQH